VAVLALRPDGPATTLAGPVTIEVDDFWFCNASFQNGVCETNVAAGTTVSWDFDAASGSHTTTECGNNCGAVVGTGGRLWHSGSLNSGTFEFTFTSAGTFNYQCNLHPNLMQGRIVVSGAPPPATPTATSPAPGPTATPTATSPGPAPTPTFTSTPPGLTGDANGDGSVNAIDATLVLQLVAGLLPSLPPTADANLSGAIDAIDAALILQFVAGLIGQLPP